MIRTARSFVVTVIVLAANSAIAGPTAGEKCESGKNGTTGKYSACLFKAQQKFVNGGELDTAGRDESIAACGTKYAEKWESIETKANGSCPTSPDRSTMQAFLGDCVSSAEDALGGGTLPTCDEDFADCGADLAVCNGDLAPCDGALAACASNCVASVRPPLRTGQTTSYGAGSDGDLQKGAVRSFTDNGDGTITDNTTGLMWEKKSDDGSIHDQDNTYTWSTGTDSMDGTMVTGFLATLNGGGGFAGYTDWRIPNRFELESLLNLEHSVPAAFDEFDDACVGGCTVTSCSCTRFQFYWSSSTYHPLASRAWLVSFVGNSNASSKLDSLHLRAVRSDS